MPDVAEQPAALKQNETAVRTDANGVNGAAAVFHPPVCRAADGLPDRFRSTPIYGEPTWEVVYEYPLQGMWTVREYFRLHLENFRRVEYTNGFLEFLPMPIEFHDLVMMLLYELLKFHVTTHAPGLVRPSGVDVRVTGKKIRMPDLAYMKEENASRRKRSYWVGADLVMEIMSAGRQDRLRDLIQKRGEYARAGISEYWIIDPRKQVVQVLMLVGKRYRRHGTFKRGERATSVLLPGFSVDVEAIFSLPGAEEEKRART